MMIRKSVGFAVAASLLVAVGLAQAAKQSSPMRIWKDATGKHTIEAKMIGFENGMVQLERSDGTTLTVPLEKLSDSDQEFIQSGGEEPGGGEPQELKEDDGRSAGKRSIAGGGHAVRFEAPEGSWAVTAVRLHGSRYGYPAPPKEDFHVWICDDDFQILSENKLPYRLFQRGEEQWVTLRIRPTNVKTDFLVCVGFNPTQTKGVYVSHDGEGSGKSMVALPDGPRRPMENGDWLIRAMIKPAKADTGKAD
ncbi:MAG: hypothetical protein GXY83_06425 [Rhodopirellula sp.]|nr:hypothetical protein [Rhodopirellula sp.]